MMLDKIKLFNKRQRLDFRTITLLGISSGLPILVMGNIKLWMRASGVDLSTIGMVSWMAIPYSINFMWSFLFDRYQISLNFGKRRSWLLLTQVLLVMSFIFLSMTDPKDSVYLVALAGTLMVFFSASQDIAVDAYRNDKLDPKELGLGSSFGVFGYRVGMWIASGVAIWATSEKTWGWSYSQMFLFLACCMSIGIVTTIMAKEPEVEVSASKTIFESIIYPFIEFLKREQGLTILALIFFYKLGDSVAGSMSRPFYSDLGIDNKVIGGTVSIVTLVSTSLGLLFGGGMIYKTSYKFTMWTAAILQALSTGLFALLPLALSELNLAGIIFVEDFTSGIGTTALVAFMGSLVNKQFTATQYALFASFASMGRTIFSGFSGMIIEHFKSSPVIFSQHAMSGYMNFYVLCMFLSLPSFVFLILVKNLDVKK